MMELITGVQNRLRLITAFNNEVYGVEEVQDAIATPIASLHTPSSYVILLAENAGENRTLPPVQQRVLATFGIVIAVENLRNPLGVQGGGQESRIQEIRKLVRTSILGYSPDPQFGPIEYVKGRLVMVGQGVLWWQDDYKCDYFITS